jgi:hypothetical protein
MKRVLPQGVWSSPIEIDLTNISLQSLLESLIKTLERIETIKEKIEEIKGTGFSDLAPASLSELLDLVSGGSEGSVTLQHYANKTLNETITGSWTFTNQIQVPSIRGSNTQDLLITGKNYGVEIRIDESDSETNTFKITRGSSGSTALLTLDTNGDTSIGGNLSVGGTITGNLTGNAYTASKLQTAVTISLSGALSGSVPFDGSEDVSIDASINAGSVGTTQLGDNSVTSSKLAPGAVIENLGYTPVNKNGDTMTGNLNVPSLTVNGNISSTGIISGKYDFTNRFTVSSSLSNGLALSASTSQNIQSIGVQVPIGKTLYIRRFRAQIVSSGNVVFQVYSNAGSTYSYTFTSSSSLVDVSLNNSIVSGSSSTRPLYIYLNNPSSTTSINVSLASGWWIEFEIV